MSTLVFWVEATDVVQLSLRRVVLDRSKPCPSGYHEATRELWKSPAVFDAEGQLVSRDPDTFPDQLWPTGCDWLCGYQFTDADARQVSQDRIYQRPDTGETWDERRLPPGAMFSAPWHPRRGPDGDALVVVLPPATTITKGHWWSLDSLSRLEDGSVGPGWTRTGNPRALPPTVEVAELIRTRGYTGRLWLEDGRSVLTDNLN